MPNVVALRAAPKFRQSTLSEELLTVARCLGQFAEDANGSDIPSFHRAAVMTALAQAACALQDAADALGKGMIAASQSNIRP